MRKKLFVGVFVAAIVGIVAVGSLYNRSGAQDATKKADEKKGDLFDILKKDLGEKKEAPPLPVPPPLPPKPELVIPPPSAPTPNLDDKTPQLPPQKKSQPDPVPSTGLNEPKPLPTPAPVIVNDAPKQKELPKPSVEPMLTFPPLEPTKPPMPTELKKVEPQLPSLADVPPPAKLDPVKPLDAGVKPDLPPGLQKDPIKPPPLQQLPAPTIPAEVAKVKNCPWTLHIEMVDNQTIVTATVNKRHEFKIVCQSLDLQTGKSTLKASGKVQITGDMLTGSCENLAISLTEDRLILEGGAAVSIQKSSTNVSDTKPAAFELKGDTLNLRISELESGKYIQTGWQKVAVDVNLKQAVAVPTRNEAARWTSFGKLVRHESKLGPLWRLENSRGELIANLVAREGGTLEQYAGRTISVLGTNEQLHGTAVLRVTHIAVP